MKNISTIVIVALIGIGIGYFIGSSNGMGDKKLEDSISMMKEQSASIQVMSDMMKTSGVAMQDLGMRYKDEAAVAEGKDLEAFGDKYMKENTKATEESDTMKEVME